MADTGAKIFGLGTAILGAAVLIFKKKEVPPPPPPPPGMGTLYGNVIDHDTGLPIAGMMVTLEGSSVLTDATGNYTIENIPPGTYTVTFTKDGYTSATF
jgi:hypothetical protein